MLSYYLPMEDGMLKMQMAMALGQMIAQILNPVVKFVKEMNIFGRLYMKNHITIESNHPQYENIINYIYNRFIDDIKGANLNNANGKKKMLIEVLQLSALKDEDIEISFGDLPKDGENKPQFTLGKKILFSSSKSLKHIEEYVSEIIKECCRKENNTLTTYSLDVTKTEKSRSINWRQKTTTSNKTIKNTIVKDSVKENFYNDLEKFMNSEDLYKTRGISYKRGYLLHGVPGSGKSSIVAAIANEFKMPVFKLDMSIIETNDELVKAETTIYDYIGPFDPHIVLIEDFDRSAIFDYDKQSKITEDCILNILDGIEQTYGRLWILTANNKRPFNRVQALMRPGRIDRVVEIDFCDNKQVIDILRLYFDKEAKINHEIEITPASLNKIIQVMGDFDSIVRFLNRFDSFGCGEEIERLAEEFKTNPEIEDEEVEEIKEDVKEYVQKTTRSRRRKKEKVKLPWGGTQLRKYENQIKNIESGKIKVNINRTRYSRRGNPTGINPTDTKEEIDQKYELMKQESQIQLKLIRTKRENLIEKMKSRGTWDDYIAIKHKKDHEEKLKVVMRQYKRVWEYATNKMRRKGRRTENGMNFRDLSEPVEGLPQFYFYTSGKNNKSGFCEVKK